MQTAKRADIVFSIEYQSHHGHHVDRLLVEKVDLWRDILPAGMLEKLDGFRTTENLQFIYGPGELVEPHSEKKIRTFPLNSVDPRIDLTSLKPGRYYPRYLAWQRLDCYPNDISPMRVVDISQGNISVDINHPLSELSLKIAIHHIQPHKPAVQRGGSINDIAEILCQDGPGMQVPLEGMTDLSRYSPYPFLRNNSVTEEEFYSTPRLVYHLDDTARGHVKQIYDTLLSPKMKVLDLMASFDSHLSEKFKDAQVTGVGLNSVEMQANSFFKAFHIQNLNNQVQLPFEPYSFDAVICTSSIEYLRQPLEMVREISRLLVPGGIVIFTISDRWFPGEEISFWKDLHQFERLGFVMDLLRLTGGFENIHTESIRGYPRPLDDKHYGSVRYSDPVYAVWGSLRKQ